MKLIEAISTKSRYALRVMIDLAEQNRGKFISLEEIANSHGISKKYPEVILKSLVQQNFLRDLRGKDIGYKLTRPPEEYKVGEILEVTEETLAIVSCLYLDSAPRERKAFCKTLPMWKKLDQIPHDFFRYNSKRFGKAVLNAIV